MGSLHTLVHFRVVEAVLGGRFVEVGRGRGLREPDAVRPFKVEHYFVSKIVRHWGQTNQRLHLHCPMFGGDQTPSHWHSDEVVS